MNCIPHVFKNDKTQQINILGYIDLNYLDDDFIVNYNQYIIDNNPILKKNMKFKNKKYIYEDNLYFDKNNHIDIIDMNVDEFNTKIFELLNKSIDVFFITWFRDKKNNKSRIIFIMDHSYVDGYDMVHILSSPFNYINKPMFKRETHILKTIYHYVVGTIIIIIMYLKILYKIIFSSCNNNNQNTETDYIKCKSFKLSDIKKFTKENGISINEFMYSLMIRTDKIYTNSNRKLLICSPLNIKTNDIIKFIPVCMYIDNSMDNNSLLMTVNKLFEHFKYSLYIPFVGYIFNYILDFININILSGIYDLYADNCDYIYTNIIGPSNLHEYNISECQFILTHKSNIITFNSISHNDNINIICSFKKDIIKNKILFEESIYKAYNELIDLDNGFFK